MNRSIQNVLLLLIKKNNSDRTVFWNNSVGSKHLSPSQSKSSPKQKPIFSQVAFSVFINDQVTIFFLVLFASLSHRRPGPIMTESKSHSLSSSYLNIENKKHIVFALNLSFSFICPSQVDEIVTKMKPEKKENFLRHCWDWNSRVNFYWSQNNIKLLIFTL